jgi:hypothetical protein
MKDLVIILKGRDLNPYYNKHIDELVIPQTQIITSKDFDFIIEYMKTNNFRMYMDSMGINICKR